MSVAARGDLDPVASAVRPDTGVASPRDDRNILLIIAAASVALFLCSSIRHYLMRSGAFDLGFFDQAVYLISQGQTPISSLRDFHVLADHASLILYPLALLYLVWPDPHMLLAAQAVGLAAGGWGVWRLGLGAGLRVEQARAIVGAYLMFPLLLTSNLFDFHPDVFAVPALLMAILAARENRRLSFCLWLAVVLSCKEVLSLTVAGMGVWLLLDRRPRFFGIVAILAGIAWFIIATKLIIPYFGEGRNASGVNYYAYLGNSIPEIAANMILKPHLVLGRIVSLDAAKYLIILAVPLVWGLHYRTMLPLLAALPAVMLNLLSDNENLRSPIFQYSLPILPFLFMSTILAVASHRAWFVRGRTIVTWSAMLLVVGFVFRMGRMQSQQAFDWEGLHHTKQAIRLLEPEGDVLTSFGVIPYVSQRKVADFIGGVVPLQPVNQYEYILFNARHLSPSEDAQVSQLLTQATTSLQFYPEYVSEDVFLFTRLSWSMPWLLPLRPVDEAPEPPASDDSPTAHLAAIKLPGEATGSR